MPFLAKKAWMSAHDEMARKRQLMKKISIRSGEKQKLQNISTFSQRSRRCPATCTCSSAPARPDWPCRRRPVSAGWPRLPRRAVCPPPPCQTTGRRGPTAHSCLTALASSTCPTRFDDKKAILYILLINSIKTI